MGGHDAHSHHIIQPATYVKVLLVLMFFMGLTILAAKWPAMEFGIVMNLLIALAIAFAKVFFIMSWFMHVKFSSPMVRTFAVIGFVFLIIMFLFTFNDYLGRVYGVSPMVNPPGSYDMVQNTLHH
jgi:cytochrome c oxidase subunit 4